MKIRIFTVTLFALLICLCPFTVFAETTPMEDVAPTEDVFATEEPINTEPQDFTDPVTDPYYTDPAYTETYDTTPSDYTEPYSSEATESSDSTEATDITATEVHTNPPEPTEPDEDSTFSDYVSPAPVYTPADQDFKEKDWQEIKLDLNADPAPGKQSFESIQNDKSKGNDSIMGFLIAGIVLIFLSLAGFTFVILYNPYKKKKAPQKAQGARYAAKPSKSTHNPSKTQRENRRTFNPDDYNDGF
ncbi:MAG: hypothetical protein IJW04_04630 [Ruminococcus sp.]|nr:hypothetical protein [Ruminococcus sp.]